MHAKFFLQSVIIVEFHYYDKSANYGLKQFESKSTHCNWAGCLKLVIHNVQGCPRFARIAECGTCVHENSASGMPTTP